MDNKNIVLLISNALIMLEGAYKKQNKKILKAVKHKKKGKKINIDLSKYDTKHLTSQQKKYLELLGEDYSLMINNKIYPTVELPEDILIKHSLDIRYKMIDFIPKNWSIKGDLNASGNKNLRFIMNGLRVKGELDISDTSVRELPSDLKVRDLSINGTKIETLPEGLNRDILNAAYSHLRSLPRNMYIKDLNLVGTKIQEIPDTIKIYNSIVVSKEDGIKPPFNFTGKFRKV